MDFASCLAEERSGAESEGHEGEGGGLDPTGGARSPAPAAEFVVVGGMRGLKIIQEFLPAGGIARVVVREPLQAGVDGFFDGWTLNGSL
jgi:hypothetical protein